MNGGIVADSENNSVHPIIKGKINLNGSLPVEVDGYSNPGLEIQAVLEGVGINKTGANLLSLDGNNTFTGSLEISSGVVAPTNAAALSSSASAGVILNGGNLQLTSVAVNTDPLFVDSANSTVIAYNTCSWGGPVFLNANLNVLPADNTRSGLMTTFSGTITGSGGMTLEDAVLTTGNVEFSGSSANTFSGPLNVLCQLLYLDKPAHTEAFGGLLSVGGGPGPVCQASWLNHYQGPNEGAVTVYTNGIVDLNGYNDNFGPVNFNGGEIETFSGQLSLFGTVTVNPAGAIAYLGGNITLPPGNPVEFNVPQGYTVGNLEFICEATISGSAPSLIKQGYGTMSITEPNTSQATTLLQEGIMDMDNASALSTTPVVISSGATLKLDVNATLNQGFEMSGDGIDINGTFGALDLASGMSVTLNGNILLDAETSLNPESGGALSLNGVISGAGPLTQIGPGTLTLGGTSPNTYVGTTYANQGSLLLSKTGNIAAVPGNLVIGTKDTLFGTSGTTAAAQGHSASIGGTNLTVNGGSTYTIVNSGIQMLASVNLVNGGSIQTGTGSLELTAGNGANVVNVNPGQSGASVISGNVYLVNGGIFAVANRVTVSTTPELDLQAGLNDQIASGISKSGAGQLRLSAANSFSSPVTVNGGTLTLATSGALGNSTSTTLNNNSILNLENSIVILNNLLTLNSSNTEALQSLSGSNTWTGGIVLAQNSAIDIQPGTGYLTLWGAMGGPGGITTVGSGTLQFFGTNANTYLGVTTISYGVLQAGRSNMVAGHNIHDQPITNEVPVTSIPGDVVIGNDDTTTTLATLVSMREEQFTSALTANVAVHLSGSLNLVSQTGQTDSPKEYAQTLTGAGQVNIGSNCTFTIYNEGASFAFSGAINGAGGFTKEGSGTMTTWGNVNNTGVAQLFGGDWELFGARHNGGITVSSFNNDSARLRGDGTVDGNVIVENLAGFGAGVAVNSHYPDHQGSALYLGSLSNVASGVTLELDMFGPSPTGGNDHIVTTAGGVSLFSDTMLTTSFNYPPRAGDVIDLISVPAGQVIIGNFANYPEGVVTLVGQTPVLPSYHGGAGHDFTLTVTNLALAYTGYQLAEGNGNQTVEPDECNLLYVSLVNLRGTSVTITNAYLRATNTTGVVVTVPVAAYPVIAAGQTMANTTPFQFSTDTNLPCGGAVGFELVLSVQNEGQFAIDFSPVSGTDCSHPTGPCDSCTLASGTFTSNTPATTQQIYFIGGPSIAYLPKAYPGLDPATNLPPFAYLTHNFTNTTTNVAVVTAQLEFACASAPTNALGVAAYLGEFDPNNPSNGYLGDGGSGGPPYPPFYFQVPAGTNFSLVIMARATNLVCENYTLQLFGLPCPPPTLAIANDTNPAKLRVNWSTAYPGYIAQNSGNPGGTFSNVTQTPAILNGRYAVTNITAVTNQFYRLKK
ncbi:MAG TPA: autotransporter-associated beta strand repeat-containing protein [Verrucomicrobiae bacterium]|nr:autotransporter-associated beta strand repeat-containing protein [Verrucomicrobiae bacterium]